MTRRVGWTEPATRLRTTSITPLPEQLAVGRGTAMFLDGRCSHPTAAIARLTVLIDEVEHPVVAKDMPLPGMLAGGDYWWSIVPFEPVEQSHLARVRLRASLAGGGETVAELGVIELQPTVELPGESGDYPVAAGTGATPQASDGRPLIAISMATFEPPLDLFERQVVSIKAQTYDNWVLCISDDGSSPERLAAMREVLGDDERLVLSPAGEHIGFYRNFERALTMVPSQASYVALADQDDRWYPEKLATLLAGLANGARLAYSDMRIVDRSGQVLSDTYWSYRRNNHTDFGSLLVANTVTGAASLFDRDLLDYILPFPPRQGDAYHDHWIALVALALGSIAYIDRPLHDYVQHRDAAIGHARANAAHRRAGTRLERSRRRLGRLRHQRFHPGWRSFYFNLYCRVALTARVAELRCGDEMAPGKARTLRWFGDSLGGIAWLATRSARPLLGATETLGRERAMLAALTWRRFVGWRTRANTLRAIRGRGVARLHAGRRGDRAVAPTMSPPQTNASSAGIDSVWLTPILVDYFTRDGSTLLMRLLSTSPQIAVEEAYPYERKYFAYIWRWARTIERWEWPDDSWGPRAFGSLAQEQHLPLLGPLPWRPRDLIESTRDEPSMSDRCFELAWREFSRRAARWTGARHRESPADVRYYAEKHLNTWMIDRRDLPAHEMIVLLRDPRDTYVSIGAFEHTRGPDANGAFGGAAHERLHQIVARHRERLRWISGLLESGKSPVVRYDELVHDLSGVSRRLEGFLDVSLRPESVAGDRVLRKRHMTAGSAEESIGRWKRELDPEVAEVFSSELRPELAALGFEA
jgi:glycosyltransferase involved in cell wall biosynthesis